MLIKALTDTAPLWAKIGYRSKLSHKSSKYVIQGLVFCKF